MSSVDSQRNEDTQGHGTTKMFCYEGTECSGPRGSRLHIPSVPSNGVT